MHSKFQLINFSVSGSIGSLSAGLLISIFLSSSVFADKLSDFGSPSLDLGNQVEFLIGDSSGIGLDPISGPPESLGNILEANDLGRDGKSGGGGGGGLTKLVVIPEPASGLMLVTALGCLAATRRKKPA